MKVTAIEEVTTKKEVVQRIECDKCGNPDVGPDAAYEVFKCTLEIHTGYHFPEGRDVQETSMDLCPVCAEELKTLLTANGFRLNVLNDYERPH